MARKTIERVTRPSMIEVIARRVSDHRIVLMWLATLVVAAVVLCFAWLFIVYPDSDGPRSTRSELIIEVEPGTSLKELASRLQREQVIADAPIWTIYMRLRGLDRHLRTGSVRFPLPVTPELAARYATTGLGRIQIPVLIPEGFNRYEIAARLQEFGICDAEDFIEATQDASLLASYGIEADSAEGYLFPDTYDFADRTKARRVVERMLVNWTRHYEALRDEHGETLDKLKGWTTHDIVTLASIVEEEAAVALERPRIAGVFWNRLRSKNSCPAGGFRLIRPSPMAAWWSRTQPNPARASAVTLPARCWRTKTTGTTRTAIRACRQGPSPTPERRRFVRSSSPSGTTTSTSSPEGRGATLSVGPWVSTTAPCASIYSKRGRGSWACSGKRTSNSGSSTRRMKPRRPTRRADC